MISVDKIGKGSGLTIVYKTLVKEFEYFCGSGKVVMIVHSPDDIPHIHHKFIQLQLNEMVYIALKPKLIKISKKMEKLKPKM